MGYTKIAIDENNQHEEEEEEEEASPALTWHTSLHTSLLMKSDRSDQKENASPTSEPRAEDVL